MLDPNLYSLTIKSNASNQLELNESETCTRYTVAAKHDEILLQDQLTQVPLGTCKKLSGKLRVLEMLNPAFVVEVKSTSSLSWEWSFSYENESFFWKRDKQIDGSLKGFTLWLNRKPDADINLVLYVAPNRRNPDGLVQFLDYNLSRLDIEDRAGLEIIILLSLCSFLDINSEVEVPNTLANRQEAKRAGSGDSKLNRIPQQPSRSPQPSTPPIDDVILGEPNEVHVLENLKESFLVEHCCELMKDQLLTYIVLKAKTPSAAAKAVKIASEVKRKRHKAGEELYQYVKDESKLAVSTNKAYQAANSISVYLSRVEMDELNPKATPKAKQPKLPPKTRLLRR